MRSELIDLYARTLTAARAKGAQVAPPAEVPTHAEALAIQSEVQRHLGAVAGFKVGPVPEGAPVVAPIPASRVYGNGAEVPSFAQAGVELEIAFELMRPLADAPLAEMFRPRLVMELVDTRFADESLDPLQKLADMQLSDGLVLGPVLDGWDGADIGTVQARMTGAGRVILDGAADVPGGGSALANLRLCLDHLGEHCGGLQVGQHVITGSLCGLPWFPGDAAVQAKVDGFGEVSVQLVPR
ncbi:hydratase [Mameliella alba]|nr:hydratase [Mameliella alba]MBY6171041.1 hydratase [Mameliella alba]MBY6176265.1 hydratase [Mameliella alba]